MGFAAHLGSMMNKRCKAVNRESKDMAEKLPCCSFPSSCLGMGFLKLQLP